MAERIVAFMDVLGFRSLVENVVHTDLVEIYRTVQAGAYSQTV